MPNPDIPLPIDFLPRFEKLLGDEFFSFSEIYTHSANIGLRVNPLKIEAPDRLVGNVGLNALQGFQNFQPVRWCKTGYYTSAEIQAGKHPYHAAGLYYLQDPSAMAVAEILAPQPGERVLDLSAAPGGKTTHLAALMGNQGVLVANEIHSRRVWELAENLERCGVTNCAITNEPPEKLAGHFGAYFDRVLVDAPCSGEGMFRKSAAARHDWSPELVRSCAIRQSAILDEAVKLVRPGGWLAYSTCTFNPQENEAVIARLLQAHPEFELAEVGPQPGFSPGRPDWVPGCPFPLARCVRLWPHLAPGEGHFVALLQKSNPISDSGSDNGYRKFRKIDSQALNSFTSFCLSTLKVGFVPERLAQVGAYIYQLPQALPDLGRLKVIHPGWWLGTLKTNRFEPSHALALGLHAADVRNILDFRADSKEVAAYLRGETLVNHGENAWVLICVDGYPLGWGKRSQGVVKNAYPKGLRSLA